MGCENGKLLFREPLVQGCSKLTDFIEIDFRVSFFRKLFYLNAEAHRFTINRLNNLVLDERKVVTSIIGILWITRDMAWNREVIDYLEEARHRVDRM